jgi:2,4-dienoyl-CoA reductase-like NADH-dependent reductase (Old Yellow Enzyme family)
MVAAEQKNKSLPAWDGAASTSLYQGTSLGPYHLAHRIAMAPLTRLRADGVTRVPGDKSAEYYAQRASKGGLIISEATIVSEAGGGYPGAPGIFTPEQAKVWKEINDGVHAKGGIIFCQFIFLGRVADPGNVPYVSAVSDIPADKDSKAELHVVTEQDLETILKEFKNAAEFCKEAGLVSNCTERESSRVLFSTSWASS